MKMSYIISKKKCVTVFFPLQQVVDIMKTNVEKVLERDQKLSELDDRAGTNYIQSFSWSAKFN